MTATAAFDRIAGRLFRGEHADQPLRSAKEAEAALAREGMAAAFDEVEA